MKLLHEFSEPISAPFARVAEVLVNVCQTQMVQAGGYVLTPVSPGTFQARSPVHTMTVEIDAPQGYFAIQGGWWYRSEYRVEPAGDGARIVQRIYNAAGNGSRWAVPLANRFFRGFEEQSRSQFGQLVADIRRAV
jgi:hypothetical protein